MFLRSRMLAGRRGDIRWKKPTFLGAGGRRDYDTYKGWGLICPFVLDHQPIHVFNLRYEAKTAPAIEILPTGIGNEAPTAPAIRLRADRGFKRSAYAQEWIFAILFLSFFTTPTLPLVAVIRWLEGKGSWFLFVVLAVLSGILLLASILIILHQRHSDRRHQDIRFLLGTHAWGSSDPTYWHTDVLPSVVKPPEAFGVDNFAALARNYVGAKDWCRAVWAARLCCAVEDIALGQQLTEEILNQPDVLELLPRLRKNPEERDDLLGPPVLLSTWIARDPQDFVFTCVLGS